MSRVKKLAALSVLVLTAAALADRAGWLAPLLARNYTPHLYCWRADPGLVWTNVSADGLIGASYVAIFLCLMALAARLRRLPEMRGFVWIFVAFGTFILSCAVTHFMEIVTVWIPVYPLSAAFKVVCAGVSLPTAILFYRVAPVIDTNISQFFSLLAASQKAEQEAKENYREQIDAINRSQMMIEFSPDGTILGANENYLGALGYAWADVAGKPHSVLVPAEDRETPQHKEFWRRLKGGVFQTGVYRRVNKQGESVWIQASYNPVFAPDGSILKIVKFGLEVTERVKTQSRLRAAEARLQAILDSVVDGIVTIDGRGTITSFNPAAARIFAFQAGEAAGCNVKMLMPEPYHGEHDGYLAHYAATGESRIVGKAPRELVGRRRDGSVFPMELSVSAFVIDGVRHYTGIVRDITERKALDAEREAMFAALSERTSALERSNQELDTFAYAASHDLKAPLRVIHNASVWIEEDLAQYMTAEVAENMNLLRSRVKRMDRLLDDLLQYARIGREADKGAYEVCSGAQLMEDTIGLLACPEGFVVDVDSSLAGIEVIRMPLQQVLFNLVSNAIKHHDKKTGLIRVWVEDRGANFLFSVSDDGPGIPAEYHDQIFKMFKTLKPRDQVEGSGMGLAMVRKHILLAGGEIHLESAEGQGSTFRFTWPRHSTPPGVEERIEEKAGRP